MVQIFSDGVREDILRNSLKTTDQWCAELAGACLVLNIFRKGQPNNDIVLILRNSTLPIANRIKLLFEQAGFQPIIAPSEKKEDEASLFIPMHQKELLRDFLLSVVGASFIDQTISDEISRRAFLRGAFLVAGSVSNPEKMYRMELSVRNKDVVKLMMLFFHAQDLTPSIIKRDNRVVIYLRDGEQIADFLAFVGAHRSRIKFEDIRTEKEIRNQVNRVVNCDTANALRQAEAGYKRSDRIRRLMQSVYVAQIPDELQLAARVLLDNPGASIRELGQLMQPPISKSGMHHRLRKLEKIAEENDLF